MRTYGQKFYRMRRSIRRNGFQSISDRTRTVSKSLLNKYRLRIFKDERAKNLIKKVSSEIKSILPAGYYASTAVGTDKYGNYVVVACVYHIAKKYMQYSFLIGVNENWDSLYDYLMNYDGYINLVPSDI